MPKPVVLIAEQLAQSALDVLGSEVEIRHVDQIFLLERLDRRPPVFLKRQHGIEIGFLGAGQSAQDQMILRGLSHEERTGVGIQDATDALDHGAVHGTVRFHADQPGVQRAERTELLREAGKAGRGRVGVRRRRGAAFLLVQKALELVRQDNVHEIPECRWSLSPEASLQNSLSAIRAGT